MQTFKRIGGSILLNIWKRRASKLWLHINAFTAVSAWENSSRRSATFSRYSLATSALDDDTICVSNPEDVALPGRAFKTPDPDSTPDAVWDATPEEEATPSLVVTSPTPDVGIFKFGVLFGIFCVPS